MFIERRREQHDEQDRVMLTVSGLTVFLIGKQLILGRRCTERAQTVAGKADAPSPKDEIRKEDGQPQRSRWKTAVRLSESTLQEFGCLDHHWGLPTILA